MSTIIRLNNVEFNNPLLPRLVAAIKSGLVGGWTLDGKQRSLEGELLSASGSPVYDSQGVTIDVANGDRLTSNIQDYDYLESTWIVVCSAVDKAGISNTHLIGSFEKSMGLYVSSIGTLKAWFKKESGEIDSTPPITVNQELPAMYVVRRSATEVKVTVPGLGVTQSIELTDDNLQVRSENILIGSTYSVSTADQGISKNHAALIYNRQLTDDEIARQHSAFKQYFGGIGLDII